ncbi:helix-turn-helix transcriptional regulator [Acholeplasma hippikon]|uniref:HTH cro/C1-type domain-containing protein n=1 Tax=Acholeplasma hippikon TaxID=264636 RepID=A0A449BJA7_9MOLU|nr:helix-turn-helix transcriptional regulator [Acholeplasma hippikon]VEU82546.1 Uncharacterised protein [Acholeplasma hippikon]
MVVDYSKELALFLEKLRFLRGISQEDFTDGIISNRQYQRYVRGESPMPFHLINEFAVKLNIKKEDLILEFQNSSIDETTRVINYFSAVLNRDLEKIPVLKKKISREFLIELENKSLFKHAESVEFFFDKKISTDQLRRNLFELCNYPDVLNRVPISLNDALILSSILNYTDTNDKSQIANKILDVIENPKYTFSAYQITTFNILTFNLAKYHGRNKEFEKCIEICKIGISFNQRKESIQNMIQYYYFQALCYKELQNTDMMKYCLFKCYSSINISDSEEKMQFYTKLIETDFNINFDEFIADYIKNKKGLRKS